MYTTTRDTFLPTTVIGSWPRPRWLTEGLWGASFSSRMNDLRYREQFVDAVTTVVNDQETAGLDILTNGDYHQDEDLGGRSWVNYPLQRLGGMSAYDMKSTDEWTYPPGTILHEVMGGWRYPSVLDKVTEGMPLEYDKIWRIAQGRTERPVKFGTVSAQMMSSVAELHTDRYTDKRELIWDMATQMNAELRKLAAAGCKAIQIEEPLIHMTAATSYDKDFIDFLVDAFNHEVSGLDDVEVWVHTCWGNPNMQRVQDDISYENSIEVYMERLRSDVWTIEWKDNSQPTLDLLKKYKGNMPKKVALGVLDHRTLQVDPPETIADDIRTISEALGPENVVLSSNCGFGRQGVNRLIAYYKAACLAQAANIVREEYDRPTTRVRAAMPELQIDG